MPNGKNEKCHKRGIFLKKKMSTVFNIIQLVSVTIDEKN
jgi:hypothetical protein